LALAHSMLGERSMAAQTQFLGLFGNHTLEERVMRLMDTTTMSVRAKAARVASGAAMMIATGVIAGMFHVTPTMAQANVPPQATQNPPAEAPAPAPEPKATSPSAAVHGNPTPAAPKKRTYVHRNGGDGEGRESALTEQRLIDKDVQQLQRQMEEVGPKVNSPEFEQQMDDLRRQMAEVGPKINSPEFKQQMDDLRRQMAEVGPKVNSPEFKQQMDDLRRQMAEVGPKVDSPEFKQQMDDLRRQLAEVGPKLNSPEFKQRMDDLQKEMQKQMEEFSREYPHSPNP
jgi:phage FluMu protein gp41